ncbi:MAG TPA: ABC transporter permease [Gammaproteobacteria bacterium]|nr:ABC transporter permease [Gammaproteobacteria bacterium]
MKLLIQASLILFGIVISWQFLIMIFHLPPYILPTPLAVFQTGLARISLILNETKITVFETLAGLLLGVIFGCTAALLMASFKTFSFWLLPILIVSQAIPTFAIAPLLVIWFGYGMTSKIAATIIMIFFPVSSSFFDGLSRTDQNWLELAKTMNAKKWRVFWYIRIPAALPHFASGLRVATVAAPIGAVIGEWVGASQGLGFLMLNANARMQIDLMFAGLFILILFSLILYFTVDNLLKFFIPWQNLK